MALKCFDLIAICLKPISSKGISVFLYILDNIFPSAMKVKGSFGQQDY